MTTDVRTLLHDAAATPERSPDIGGALRSARVRRRRQRGFGALTAVVVIALVVGVVALGSGGGDSAQVAIGPHQTGAQIPDGWKTLTADPGISIAIPPGWDSYDFGATDVAETRLAVGTSQDLPEGTSGCTAKSGAISGTWINVWEYDPSSTTATVRPVDPNSGATGIVYPVTDRPETFARANWLGGACPGGRYEELAFRDAGRVFVARVTVVATPEGDTAASLSFGEQVLNTLHVEPLEGGSTTVPSTTIPPTISGPAPLPAITTLPPFVPSTDDEREINDLFLAWLQDHPDADTRRIVEDADALLDSIHEGLAQHTAADLAGYSGTVSAIRMLDADHAEVQYTLLHGGQPQFGLRTGVAVRIDGHWMVSRATECALLSLGGITCPPE